MGKQPSSSCPSTLKRALGLGFLGGVLVAELHLVARAVLAASWSDWKLWALLVGVVAPVGGLVGMADGVFTLLVVWLAGRRVRRHMPLVSLIGGLAAATVPALVLLRTLAVRWLVPLVAELTVAAFLIGAVLTWPVLTGRPCLQRLGWRPRT